MSGRDIMALAVGLYESCDFNYMNERVAQCATWQKASTTLALRALYCRQAATLYINMDEFFDGKRGHDTFAGEGFSGADPPLRHPCIRVGRLLHGGMT